MDRRQFLLGSSALLASGPAWSADIQNFDIIVTAGQSNTQPVGQGAFSDPWASPANDARCFAFGRYENDFTVQPTFQTVQTLNGPVYGSCNPAWDVQPACNGINNHSFGATLSRIWAAQQLTPGRNVLWLSAGEGSTSILEWNGKLIIHPTSPILVSDMLGRLKYLTTRRACRLIGFCFAGPVETDLTWAIGKKHNMTATLYGAELKTLLGTVRAAYPTAPILMCHMSPDFYPHMPQKKPFQDAIDAAVASVKGRVVQTTGLRSNPTEPPHFNAGSMVVLAHRFYNGLLALRR